MAKQNRAGDERTKTSLSRSRDWKRMISHPKANLRVEGFKNATESTILEAVILNTNAREVARIHPKPKRT
jgi:hypothetical protein